MSDQTRNEVARIIWETSRADEGTISATGANIVADALLPLLAQMKREWQAEVGRAVLAARVACPVHGIPDCGPLLNGCSVPRYIAEWRGEFMGDLRAALGEPNE